MEIKNILKEFVQKCSGELNLSSIIQFGSSTHSKKFHDLDLMFIFNEGITSSNQILKLIGMIKDFEKKYEEVVFDFSGVADRKRVAKYSVTVVPIGKKDLDVVYNPHDLFFYKNLSGDKNLKILFGKNPFIGRKITLTKQHLFEILSVDLNHSLRKSLDDKKTKLDSSYFLFKTFIRVMLINSGVFKKTELLGKFKDKYGRKISLPSNAKKIIKNELVEGDFVEILEFAKDCLKYLGK